MSGESAIYTVGHSARPIADVVDQLRRGPVELVVDVRTIRRSRRNPQYDEDVLGTELAAYQIGYLRIPGLGGLRRRSSLVPPEVNAFWENQSVHNYADYALSAEFEAALGELMQTSISQCCAIMCAEAVWWRCHRRIIADYLLTRNRTVFHLMGGDRVESAKLTTAAKLRDGKIIYPRTG